jgi:hypothetical protein
MIHPQPPPSFVLDPLPQAIGSGLTGLVQGLFEPPPDTGIFIDRPIEELIRPYKELTGHVAEKLTEGYQWKWVRIVGAIEDFQVLSFQGHPTIRMINEVENGRPLYCTFEFDHAWSDKLTHLPKGQVIRVAGRIHTLSWSFVKLVQCRLET